MIETALTQKEKAINEFLESICQCASLDEQIIVCC